MIKTNLLQKIKDVISDNDTVGDILDKILVEYPDVLEYKKNYYNGDEKKAHAQLKSEISSYLFQNEDKYFIVDSDVHPNRHSLIIDVEIDIIESIDDICDSDIGHIYFIDPGILAGGGQKMVKIGVASNIAQRMKQLKAQQFAIYELKLMKSYKVYRPFKVEHALHCALDRGRISSSKEFFYVDYIEKNMNMIEMIINNFKCRGLEKEPPLLKKKE